ncbi:MAG: hypothetical protein LUF30_05195 [Lachnospiraceae bacterium]|nr:hypothetical protein [Lachnospiraceae bacterium]
MISTKADYVFREEDGTISIGAAQEGLYSAEFSDGTGATATITVSAIEWDGIWNVSIEQWSAGEIVSRTETRDNIDPYTGEIFEYEGSTSHDTTEYSYETDKEVVLDTQIANEDLVCWKDLYGAGLADFDLTTVCGVGTYTTTFTAAEEGQKILINLGAIDGMVGLTVNGTKFVVDIDNCQTDISKAVQEGENEIVVTVCTTLTNTLTDGAESLVRGMQESAPYYPIVYKNCPESYGLTEPVQIIPYGTQVVYQG